MSFDNVQLPALVVADLYKQSLVVLDDVQLKPPKPLIKIVDTAVEVLRKLPGTPQKIIEEIKNEPDAITAEPEITKPVISYLGGFKQQVSVVVSEEGQEHISSDNLEFLKKMMAACKLTVDDMAIINVVPNQPAARQLWQLMPAKVVLMFDVSTDSIGIPFYQPYFKVQHWDNAKFMNAPSLSAFRGPDTPELKTLKRELWEGLQKIFLAK